MGKVLYPWVSRWKLERAQCLQTSNEQDLPQETLPSSPEELPNLVDKSSDPSESCTPPCLHLTGFGSHDTA